MRVTAWLAEPSPHCVSEPWAAAGGSWLKFVRRQQFRIRRVVVPSGATQTNQINSQLWPIGSPCSIELKWRGSAMVLGHSNCLTLFDNPHNCSMQHLAVSSLIHMISRAPPNRAMCWFSPTASFESLGLIEVTTRNIGILDIRFRSLRDIGYWITKAFRYWILNSEASGILDIGFQKPPGYWILDSEASGILDIEPQPTNPISHVVT